MRTRSQTNSLRALKAAVQWRKWKVPAPALDHAVDLCDDVGRWPPGTIATRERLHRLPQLLAGGGRGLGQGEPGPPPPAPGDPHRKAEEGEGLPPRVQDSGLRRVQCEAEGLELLGHERLHLRRRLPTTDHEVVRGPG